MATRRATAHVHDELITPDGELRPHYDTFVRSLETLGRHELASRWENAKRAIRDNGVTYNVYGDPEGVDRPWTLDMIPLLVPSAEWNRLEAALDPASTRPQSVLERSLRSAAAAARTAAAAVAGVRQPGLPAPVPWHRGAARHPSPSARRGSRALARRSVVGARRSHAGAIRRRIHARESHRPVAEPARGVSRLPGRSGWRRSSGRSATR